MSVRKPSVLLATVLAVTVAVGNPSTTEAYGNKQVGVECGHARGVVEAKHIARRSWSRPYGPTHKDRRIWKLTKQCARTSYQREVRFPNLWAHYKSLYASDRKVSRLKLSCGDQTTQSVMKCIEYASVLHEYPLSILVRIAQCESHLNPYAGNPSGASGLFQFMPSTFSSTVYRMRADGYDNGGDIYSAMDNSTAAAYKMKHDGTGEWSCA